MTQRGAPLGNTNAQKGKIWTAAIQRALARRDKCRSDGIKEIDALADELIKAVASGDLAALKEFGDRLEGKPVQQIDANVDASLTVEVMRYADTPEGGK